MSRAAATARQSATVHQLRRADPSPLRVSALNPELRVLALQYSERYCDEHGDYPDYGVAKAWAVKQMAIDRCFWAKDHDRKEMLKHGRAARKAATESGAPGIRLATVRGKPADMFRAVFKPQPQQSLINDLMGGLCDGIREMRIEARILDNDPSCPIFLSWLSDQNQAAKAAGKQYPLYDDLVRQYVTEAVNETHGSRTSA